MLFLNDDKQPKVNETSGFFFNPPWVDTSKVVRFSPQQEVNDPEKKFIGFLITSISSQNIRYESEIYYQHLTGEEIDKLNTLIKEAIRDKKLTFTELNSFYGQGTSLIYPEEDLLKVYKVIMEALVDGVISKEEIVNIQETNLGAE